MRYDLYHIGMPRRSGRYKWGSGKNPFQRGGGASSKNKPRTRTLNEDEKERLIRSGDAERVTRYKRQLSNKQLNNAVNRIETEIKLEKLRKEQVTSGRQKFLRSTSKFAKKTAANVAKGYFTKTATKAVEAGGRYVVSKIKR